MSSYMYVFKIAMPALVAVNFLQREDDTYAMVTVIEKNSPVASSGSVRRQDFGSERRGTPHSWTKQGTATMGEIAPKFIYLFIFFFGGGGGGRMTGAT